MMRRGTILLVGGVLAWLVASFLLVRGIDGTTYAAVVGGDPQWQAVGPWGGIVTEVTVDPNNPTRLYARTHAGIYRSTNGGVTWTLGVAEFYPGGELPLLVDPTNASHIWAELSQGSRILESVDGGVTWNLLTTPFNSTAVAFDSVVNGRAWALSDEEIGVYRTVNGGQTWEPVPYSGGEFPEPTSILAHPTIANKIYVSSPSGAIYVSTDGGDTWDERGNIGPRLLEAIDANTGTLYAIYNEFAPSAPVVMRSVNDGETWESMDTGLDTSITSLVIDPYDSTRLYAVGRNYSVYKTQADGTSWVFADVSLPQGSGRNGAQLAIAKTQPATLYYAGGDLMRTDDEGTGWLYSGRGIAGRMNPGLAVDPANSLHALVGTGLALQETFDGGQSWIERSFVPENEVRDIAFAPGDSTIVYLSTDRQGIFRSTNGGASWDRASTGLPLKDEDLYYGIITIAVDPSDPNRVVAGVDLATIYLTTNGGSTWSLMFDGAETVGAINAVAFVPSNPIVVWGGTNNGLVRSTDQGVTWAQVTTSGLPNSVDIVSLAIHPTNGDILYAGTVGDGLLYRSTDGGTTWDALPVGLSPSFTRVDDIWIDPATSQTVLFSANRYDLQYGVVTEGFGVRRSTDGGDTWEADTRGLTYPGVTEIAGTGERLYVNTHFAGVWRLGEVPVVLNRHLYLPVVRSAGTGE